MSEKNRNQGKTVLRFGPLCRQLISMCQKSRNQRVSDQKLVRSVATTPSEDLTQLIGASSFIGKNEQNSHEEFYRQHYENLNPSA